MYLSFCRACFWRNQSSGQGLLAHHCLSGSGEKEQTGDFSDESCTQSLSDTFLLLLPQSLEAENNSTILALFNAFWIQQNQALLDELSAWSTPSKIFCLWAHFLGFLSSGVMSYLRLEEKTLNDVLLVGWPPSSTQLLSSMWESRATVWPREQADREKEWRGA